MKIGLLLLTSILLFEQDALCAPSYVRTIVAGHSWSIGNEWVERAISFSTEQGLRTDKLTYKVTGRDFLDFSRSQKQYGEEIAVRGNQQQITGESLRVLGADSVDIADGKVLRVRTATRDGLLAIVVNYAVYDDAPAVRKWISITNQGTNPVSLSNLVFEALAAAPGTPADLEVNGGYGTVPRELFFTGRVSDPAVVLRNSFTREGLAIINEAPGYLKRTEIGEGWGERFRVMYDTDLFPFRLTLQAHETFESAKCSLVFFSDNHGLQDSHWTIPGYVARHIMRRPSHGGPPWIFNTWEPFLRGINQKTVGELATAAEQMGVNIFTIDDGWQAEYGSNEVDSKNFPGGYSQIHSTLQQHQLKLGLWVPLAAISTKSPDYQTHPEWACKDQNGHPKFTSTASGTSAVMCLASGYREAALKRLEDLITRYRPAYIKIDLTTVFNAYGEAPGCYAKNHSHHDWAESLTLIYQGLEYIGEQLYRDHPEVLVDYTFELWGEKHIIDPALLECADLDWLSNVDDQQPQYGGPLHARMLLYQRALSTPAETMLIGNLRAPTGSIEEHFATAIGSAPLFLGDLRKLSDADRRWYKEKIFWYQQLRSRAVLSDSFFPLGNWQQPASSAWDGFARLSHESDGIIVLFKNNSNAKAGSIQIQAPPNASYEVRSVITGSSLGKLSSGDLAKGWQVSFPAAHAVEILELRRIGH